MEKGRSPGDGVNASVQDCNGAFVTLGKISVAVGGNRTVKVVNRGNTNGDALLGLLSHIATPARNRVKVGKHVTSVLRIKANFGPRVANHRGICVGNTVLNVAGTRISTGVRRVVSFSRIHRFVSAPIGHCSDNVCMGLTFSITTRLSDRVVVVSRILTINSVTFRGGYLSGVHRTTAGRNEAILCMDRGVGAVHRLYSEYIILSGNGIIFSKSMRGTVSMCVKSSRGVSCYCACARGRQVRPTSGGGFMFATLSVLHNSGLFFRYGSDVRLGVGVRMTRGARNMEFEFRIRDRDNDVIKAVLSSYREDCRAIKRCARRLGVGAINLITKHCRISILTCAVGRVNIRRILSTMCPKFFIRLRSMPGGRTSVI